jgi:hypothetical protein
VVDKSDQYITCFVHSIQDNVCWYQTFVYGANLPIDR